MVESIKRQMTPKKFRAKELNKSKGILDDYAVRKFVGTKEGTITKIPVNPNDITNKSYVDGVLHAPVTVTDSSTINFTLTVQNITATTIDAAIDHNALLNFVGNEHIDWTNATSQFLTTKTLTGTGNLVFANGTYTATTGGCSAVKGAVIMSPTGNSTSHGHGIYGSVQSGTDFDIASMKGLDYGVNHGKDGDVTDIMGAEIGATISSTGKVSNLYGIKLLNTVTIAGDVDFAYGLYLESAYAGSVSKKYGVYQKGAGDINYFEGPLNVRNAATFNADGDDVDFVIKGDTATALFYVDASTDRIGINDKTPSYTLDVAGQLRATDYYSGDGSQGITSSFTILDGDRVTNHNFVFKDGLLTAYDNR